MPTSSVHPASRTTVSFKTASSYQNSLHNPVSSTRGAGNSDDLNQEYSNLQKPHTGAPDTNQYLTVNGNLLHPGESATPSLRSINVEEILNLYDRYVLLSISIQLLTTLLVLTMVTKIQQFSASLLILLLDFFIQPLCKPIVKVES